MPRHKKDIDDGLDTSSESDKETFEISDTLLLEEKELFEGKLIIFLFEFEKFI
jgi:hypothetical protein